MIEINHHPEKGQLRIFAMVWFVFFCGAGGVVLWNSMPTPIGISLLAVGIVVPVLGTLYSEFTRRMFVGFSYATYPIGYLVTLVLLVFVYYLVLTPIGFSRRLFGLELMPRNWDSTVDSYWEEADGERDLEDYFRQY